MPLPKFRQRILAQVLRHGIGCNNGSKAQALHRLTCHIILGQIPREISETSETLRGGPLEQHRLSDHARMSQRGGQNHSASIKSVEINLFERSSDILRILTRDD